MTPDTIPRISPYQAGKVLTIGIGSLALSSCRHFGFTVQSPCGMKCNGDFEHWSAQLFSPALSLLAGYTVPSSLLMARYDPVKECAQDRTGYVPRLYPSRAPEYSVSCAVQPKDQWKWFPHLRWRCRHNLSGCLSQLTPGR